MNLFADNNTRTLREYYKTIDEIRKYGYHEAGQKPISELYEDAITGNTDLKAETQKLKDYVNHKPDNLDDVLPKAFAIISEAIKRKTDGKIIPHPEQLMGAMALHDGNIAEMKTGEGKTLTAVMTAYLNALTEAGVHIATSNDRLAEDGYDEMAPILEEAGLSVGLIKLKRESQASDPNLEYRRRREAYHCDITYGSSEAFAFDYLRDNIADTKEKIVMRNSEVGFAIIDEADQILVGSATMPYLLSGTEQKYNETDLEKARREQELKQEQKELNEFYDSADRFIYSLYQKPSECVRLGRREEYEDYLHGDKKISDVLHSVVYARGIGATLTEKGWLQAFRYFRKTEINHLLKEEEIKNMILSSNAFEEGERNDYTIDPQGNISLTLRGIETGVREIPRMKALNNSFYSDIKYTNFFKYLDNSLTAYFTLENELDYTLIPTDDEQRFNKQKVKVSLLVNGRTAEGRVYSNGLQQAIELKETRLNRDKIIERSSENNELASISQKAYYSMYSKIAGMTGTSAEEIFDNIYQLSTVKIPKHAGDNREDKSDILFATKEEKLKAVIASITESHQKGQPVLIGTNSIEESNKLGEELKKRGIPCEILVATKEGEEEKKIIQKAGRFGAVTVSTQMAGRGTDIKLGGEEEDVLAELIDNRAKAMVHDHLTRNGRDESQIDAESLSQLYASAHRFLTSKKMNEMRMTAKISISMEKEQICSDEVGGLKVIGYNHYATKRDDDQLRGRAARQDDPGVTEFYSSLQDMNQLGITMDQKKKLRKQGLKEGNPLQGEIVRETIFKMQQLNESNLSDIISNTQEVDRTLSMLRRTIYDQRKRMVLGEEDMSENMEFIISSSVINTIDRNVPTFSRAKDKIAKSGLDVANFVIDVEETFGIDIEEKLQNNEFKTLGDLQEFITNEALKNYANKRQTNGEVEQNKIDQENILQTIDSAWRNFNANLDSIEQSSYNYKIVNNSDYKEIHEMKKLFNQTMVDEKINLVSGMMGVKSVKKRPVISEEESDLEDENNYSIYDDTEEKKGWKNVSMRPGKVMATLSNRIKVVKDKILGRYAINDADSASKGVVEEMDFNSSVKK